MQDGMNSMRQGLEEVLCWNVRHTEWAGSIGLLSSYQALRTGTHSDCYRSHRAVRSIGNLVFCSQVWLHKFIKWIAMILVYVYVLGVFLFLPVVQQIMLCYLVSCWCGLFDVVWCVFLFISYTIMFIKTHDARFGSKWTWWKCKEPAFQSFLP